MRLRELLFALVASLGCSVVCAAQSPPTVALTVSVRDNSSAPVRNELVILQNMDDRENEIIRALTDDKGEIPIVGLHAGLYRAIATAPYGIWRTTVHEFLVGEKALQVTLSVEPMSSHGNGDTVITGNGKMTMRVVDSAGKPIAGAAVLARDREATLYLERWYKTAASGTVALEAIEDPIVVVVVYGKTLVTREFSSKRIAETIVLPPQ
jgi:hypothetical protein